MQTKYTQKRKKVPGIFNTAIGIATNKKTSFWVVDREKVCRQKVVKLSFFVDISFVDKWWDTALALLGSLSYPHQK